MAYARTLVAPRALAGPERVPRKPSLLSRIAAAIEAANMRRAEREIARYLGHGGKFTDETEREIERRFLANMR